MPRPGVDIQIVDDAPRGGAVLDTGQAFMVGVTERGPTDRALRVLSLKDYANRYGARSGGSLLYDSVGAFFSEGGSVLYCSRIANADAAAASKAFGSLTAHASSSGTWGNGVTVTAEALEPPVAGSVQVTVTLGGTVVERSPTCATADDLVAWDATLVSFTKGADNVLPAAGTSATLTGGTNGTGTVDHDSVQSALDRFDSAMGPGQVLAPGLTADAVHEALCEHAQAKMRCALLELPDSADPTVLKASVAALQGDAAGQPGARFAAAFSPWALYPSSVVGAGAVLIPYTGLQAGLIAKADAGGNPNEPAAGANGASRFGLGLSQAFTDDQREDLNSAGVCMAKMVYGAVETYGYRTAAGPDEPNWRWFGNSRVVMAVGHEANAVAETYVLRQIDGKRRIFAKLESDLRGICLRYYNASALFGDTPEEAFSVDTGAQVNTIATIAAGEIHAVIRLRCSPSGEWVSIEIIKVPVERAVAA